MTVLCLGPKGAGKTHLLSSLQHPGSIDSTSHSVPTIGTNLFSIELPTRTQTAAAAHSTASSKRCSVVTSPNAAKAAATARTAHVREVGGSMAPMWTTYLGDVTKIMYVVDTSNLCQISAAGECFLDWVVFD